MKRTSVSSEVKAVPNGLAVLPAAQRYVLRLFVTGNTPKSAQAVQNIRAICDENLFGRYDLEVIDIYQHPADIKLDQIVVTPTLVKRMPLPFRKIVGDLSDTERVLAGLDLVPMGRPVKLPGK